MRTYAAWVSEADQRAATDLVGLDRAGQSGRGQEVPEDFGRIDALSLAVAFMQQPSMIERERALAAPRGASGGMVGRNVV